MLTKQKQCGCSQKRENRKGEEEGMYRGQKGKGLALSLCWGQDEGNKGGYVFSCKCTN